MAVQVKEETEPASHQNIGSEAGSDNESGNMHPPHDREAGNMHPHERPHDGGHDSYQQLMSRPLLSWSAVYSQMQQQQHQDHHQGGGGAQYGSP